MGTMQSNPPALLCKARWIWPGLGFHDLHNGYALFRRMFVLHRMPRQAEAWLTADQSYQLWVNGVFVCRGPARGLQASWSFDEVNLMPYLRKGTNVFAVRAYNCGHSTFGYRTEGFAGLLFAAQIGSMEVLSDKSWACRRQNEIHRDTVPLSLQLPGHQEWVDMRLADPSWTAVRHDQSAWGPSPEERPWNALPYFNLEPRGMPLLCEESVSPASLLGVARGKSAKNYLITRDLAALRAGEKMEHTPTPRKSPRRVLVPPGSKGDFQSFLFDFGRVVVGSPRLTVSGARGGEMIDFLGVEHMKEETPCQPVDDHSKVRLANRMVCRKGINRHQFFHHLGFRYAVITVRDNSGPLSFSFDLAGCRYPLNGTGSFECSEPLLTRIWNAAAHTQRICALDAYVDTPWREQAQWWGDARIQAWNTFHLCSDSSLLRRGIACMAGQMTPDGLTYGHAPTMAHNCVLPDFSLVWILTLWDHYWQTGLTEALETHADRVISILDYFRKHTCRETGLVAFDPRYWLFLDWTTLQREGIPALLNLWLLHVLQCLETLIPLTGLPSDFCGVTPWRKRLTASLRRQLLRPDGLMSDGLLLDGKQAKTTSIHAQTLAHICRFPGFRSRYALESIVLPWVRGENPTQAPPSAYWCAYPLDWLAAEGYGAEVLAFFRKHWAAMANYGSTFEDFDPDQPAPGHLSRSHAWSAHPIYLLPRILGGIRQTGPGWSAIRLEPQFFIEWADVNVPTPRGDIHVKWKGTARMPILEINCPEDMIIESSTPYVRR